MSMINTPSDMAFLPEEDVAPIPVAQQRAAVEAGVLSPQQPGLAPEATEQVTPPVDPYAAKRRYYTASSSVVVENGRRIQVVTDIDGNVTRTDIGPADTTGGGEDDDEETTIPAAGREFDEDAFARLGALLGRIGLQGLTGRVRELVAKGVTDGDAILFELRGTDEYKKRFAANAKRAAKGLPELAPSTYVGLEESYRTLLRGAGLPLGFYDEPSDFEKFIENDVSASELNTRVQQGFVMVRDADPEVKRQMQRLYNVGENELAAYFLDPDRATPILTRQAQAAKISARAREQAGFTLLAQTAEDLVARGYSPEEAQTAFERAGQLAGLYQEMGGEEMLTEQQKVGAALGFDVRAQQALERRRAQRVAEFAGGGGFARTTGATSGTVETGVGTAQ